MALHKPLTEAERILYEWQLGVADFGEAGQERLKAASVLVSRVGGVGGAVAQQLAVAGVGRLILAHAGELRTKISRAKQGLFDEEGEEDEEDDDKH